MFDRDPTAKSPASAVDTDQLRLLATVFEASEEGMVVTDPHNRIQLVNPAFSDITGYTAAEALGQDPRLLKSGLHGIEFYKAMWDDLTQHSFWQGELTNRRKDGRLYPVWLTIRAVRDEAGQAVHHVAIFRDLTDAKRIQERIRYHARHDALTGLPNRGQLRDHYDLMVSLRTENPALALMLIDLDRFKTINESLGHQMGDVLLKVLAERMQAVVGEQGMVARVGGDEFGLLLPIASDGRQPLQLAQQLINALGEPCGLAGHQLQITPSIGIAVYPENGRSLDELLSAADSALAQVKESGRNGYRFASRELHHLALDKLLLEYDLRQAVASGQFVLHYQPQVSGSLPHVKGVEALVRWPHPVRGLVSPGTFIPLAEENGQIAQVGDWVLHTAAEQCRRWLDAGLEGLTVAVNVSTQQFHQSSFIDSVREVLRTYRLPEKSLELELTESLAIKQVDETRAALLELKQLGVRLALDDFGTGYSSLAYLKRLPLDRLKIDQSFVRGIPDSTEDMAIVRAVVAIAHALGCEVIAEGVETAAQEAFLIQAGCDMLQGYRYARPLPTLDATDLLERCLKPR